MRLCVDLKTTATLTLNCQLSPVNCQLSIVNCQLKGYAFFDVFLFYLDKNLYLYTQVANTFEFP